MNRNDTQFKLRLPPDVREQIRKQAFVNRRSMTAEIIFQLEQACAPQQTKTAPGGEIAAKTPDAVEA